MFAGAAIWFEFEVELKRSGVGDRGLGIGD